MDGMLSHETKLNVPNDTSAPKISSIKDDSWSSGAKLTEPTLLEPRRTKKAAEMKNSVSESKQKVKLSTLELSPSFSRDELIGSAASLLNPEGGDNKVTAEGFLDLFPELQGKQLTRKLLTTRLKAEKNIRRVLCWMLKNHNKQTKDWLDRYRTCRYKSMGPKSRKKFISSKELSLSEEFMFLKYAIMSISNKIQAQSAELENISIVAEVKKRSFQKFSAIHEKHLKNVLSMNSEISEEGFIKTLRAINDESMKEALDIAAKFRELLSKKDEEPASRAILREMVHDGMRMEKMKKQIKNLMQDNIIKKVESNINRCEERFKKIEESLPKLIETVLLGERVHEERIKESEFKEDQLDRISSSSKESEQDFSIKELIKLKSREAQLTKDIEMLTERFKRGKRIFESDFGSHAKMLDKLYDD
ncbi:hypothetical protein ACOME3_007308 [Neoechinorhynchus agilis]